MKKCPYCAFENDDQAVQCITCHTDLAAPPKFPRVKWIISPAEDRLWKQMTFRQFAMVVVRLQALWLFFDAAMDLTYLFDYFGSFFTVPGFSFLAPEMKRPFFLAILRIGLRITAGIALIQYAERFLSWMVRDWITKAPRSESEQ